MAENVTRKNIMRSFGRYPWGIHNDKEYMRKFLETVAMTHYESAVWAIDVVKRLMKDFHAVRVADLYYLSDRRANNGSENDRTSKIFYYGWDKPEDIEKAEIVQNDGWWEIHMPEPYGLSIFVGDCERSADHAEY